MHRSMYTNANVSINEYPHVIEVKASASVASSNGVPTCPLVGGGHQLCHILLFWKVQFCADSLGSVYASLYIESRPMHSSQDSIQSKHICCVCMCVCLCGWLCCQCVRLLTSGATASRALAVVSVCVWVAVLSACAFANLRGHGYPGAGCRVVLCVSCCVKVESFSLIDVCKLEVSV